MNIKIGDFVLFTGNLSAMYSVEEEASNLMVSALHEDTRDMTLNFPYVVVGFGDVFPEPFGQIIIVEDDVGDRVPIPHFLFEPCQYGVQ